MRLPPRGLFPAIAAAIVAAPGKSAAIRCRHAATESGTADRSQSRAPAIRMLCQNRFMRPGLRRLQ